MTSIAVARPKANFSKPSWPYVYAPGNGGYQVTKVIASSFLVNESSPTGAIWILPAHPIERFASSRTHPIDELAPIIDSKQSASKLVRTRMVALFDATIVGPMLIILLLCGRPWNR
jgi:hypothetical protein